MNRAKVKEEFVADIEALNDLIVDAIQDIKGKNILKLDLRSLDDAPADYFIICEGDSSTQINAIAGNIQKRTKTEIGQRALHREGLNSTTWVLVDYFNTIVHVFHPESREFYALEELWGDAEITEYQNL